MRINKGDFVHPALPSPIKDKILYDEREWRSIKFSGKDDAVMPQQINFYLQLIIFRLPTMTYWQYYAQTNQFGMS